MEPPEPPLPCRGVPHKRLDGGAFEETIESGAPIVGLGTSQLIGGNVEQSNTDIADEFTKLIVTQQAFSANSKVITTADQMMSYHAGIIGLGWAASSAATTRAFSILSP